MHTIVAIMILGIKLTTLDIMIAGKVTCVIGIILFAVHIMSIIIVQ